MKHLIIAALLVCCLSSLAPAYASGKGIVMNFSDVEISTMVKFISELTGKNFVLDERVKGKISIFSPSKLSNDEAFALFTSVLELKGFTLVQTGKVYKIIPSTGAKQTGVKLFGDKERLPGGEAYVGRVFTLEQISSQEAQSFLQPIVSKDGHIGSFGPGNMLLIVDTSANLQKVADILKLIDTPTRREGAELIYLKNGSSEAIAKVLQEWLTGKSAKQGGAAGQVQSAGNAAVQIIADTRLNALLLFGSETDKKDIRALVTQLDVPPPGASSKITVHYLEHADATEVAKVLDSVIKGVPVSTAATPATGAAPAATASASPFESGKVTVTPDKGTNSLIIMASPADQQHLQSVIQKLDKRRRQVFVEAMIAEVSLTKLDELGVDWGTIGAASKGNVTVGGVYDPNGTLSSLATAVSSMKSAGITLPELTGNTVNFSVILKALKTAGALNVLSTPTILTSDNKEAEIFVGENVPFQTGTTQSTITTTSVERKDVGISLKLTPQISEGDFVKLDIYQEIADIKESVIIGSNTTDRITTKRSAKTSVVVKNEETVSIGGLIQEKGNVVESKVPLLGDIPLIGWFFKSKSNTKTKTNLLILLTPRVVRDAADLRKITDTQQERFKKKGAESQQQDKKQQ